MSFFRRKSKPAAHVATSTPTQAAAPVAVAERDALTGDYTIDASHSRLGFSARHAMVTTVRGQFTDFEGTAHVDAEKTRPPRPSPSPSAPPASRPAPPTATATWSPPTSSTSRTTTPSPSRRPPSSATAPSGPSPAT